MGMFDTVLVPCPNCGKLEEVQSKGGECLLFTYELNEAPFDVLSDVNRHAPFNCENCDTNFKVEFSILATTKIEL